MRISFTHSIPHSLHQDLENSSWEVSSQLINEACYGRLFLREVDINEVELCSTSFINEVELCNISFTNEMELCELHVIHYEMNNEDVGD